MKEEYYRDKWVWITGASSGIGKALAVELSRQGANLILSARRMEALSEVKLALKNPHKCILKTLDMRDKVAIETRTQEVLGETGRIDILFNNAGISQRSLVRDTADEVDLALIETNLLGPIRHSKEVLPTMLKQGAGHIVVMSSVTGKIGTPYRSAYAASKHGLHGFFDSLRAEESKNGIFVSIICPGYIHTNISSNALMADGAKQGTMDKNSLKGMSPEYFAQNILKKISQKKPEILIGGKEIIAVYLKRFFPAILRKILVNLKP